VRIGDAPPCLNYIRVHCFTGGPNGPLLPEIRAMFPNAPLIPRAGEINAWDSTEFVNAVKVGHGGG
jgi:hypothetical protein